MKVFRTQQEMTPYLEDLKSQGNTIGYVATMGALHLGHISLVQESQKENDFTIVSIFVNPTQFNNAEDLEKYPRTEEADIALLEEFSCDFVYIPEVQDLYASDEKAKKYDFGNLDKVMEGAFRPGHFDGVATIVSKLLRAINPTKAYFGEKDFQQIRIIQEMVKQENLLIDIVPIPIKRAENGLALSSRNARLTSENLNAAPFIYKTLSNAKDLKNTGASVENVKDFVLKAFAESDFELEYFQIVDENTLQEINDFETNDKIRAFVTVYAGEIRLIDNLSFS